MSTAGGGPAGGADGSCHIEVEAHGRVLLAHVAGAPGGRLVAGLTDELAALVEQAERSDDIGAVVLAATGPSVFFAHAPVLDAGELVALHDTMLQMNASGVVFVAALGASALGVGCELALACDMRIMAAGVSVLGLPDVLLGQMPGAGGTQRLSRLIGVHHALRHLLVGQPMTPEEALEAGAVDKVVCPDQLITAAVGLGHLHASRDKALVGSLKRSVLNGSGMDLEDGLALERAEVLHLAQQEHR